MQRPPASTEPPSRKPGNRSGFTLLELMVVLVLLGLIVALTLPNLERLYDSVTRSTERDRILDQLAALGQDTALVGRDRVIVGTTGAVADLDETEARRLGEVLALDMPEGWDLRVDEPLIIRANGVCLGAEVSLLHRGELLDRLDLKPPFCTVDRNRD